MEQTEKDFGNQNEHRDPVPFGLRFAEPVAVEVPKVEYDESRQIGVYCSDGTATGTTNTAFSDGDVST